MKMIHISIPGFDDATLEGYILDCELKLGQETKRPAIVVCPGGGYVYCSPREAEPVALRYAAAGYHAFVLRYSTGRNCTDMAPMKQIDWVIGHLRENAENWNIDPNKILTCGFSAGGHLAFWAGVQAQNRPNGMILGYPAVSAPNIPGADFMLKLLMGKNDVTDEDAKKFDLLSFVDNSAPPVFLVSTAEDLLTNYGALLVANKYARLGLGYEMHVFQHGPHGYSLADETSADGSSQVLNPAYATWHSLSVEWMKKVYGQPQFVNESTSKMGKYLADLGISMPGQPGNA